MRLDMPRFDLHRNHVPAVRIDEIDFLQTVRFLCLEQAEIQSAARGDQNLRSHVFEKHPLVHRQVPAQDTLLITHNRLVSDRRRRQPSKQSRVAAGGACPPPVRGACF